MSELRYLVATKADFATAYALLNEACAWVRSKGIKWVDHYPRQWVVHAIDSGEFYLVHLASEAVATFILTERSDPFWEDRPDAALYLHALSVRRKHAGQGLGQQILDWATAAAGRRGKQFLRLDCSAANPRLRQYYLDAGFTFVGIHPEHTWHALFQRAGTHEVGDGETERLRT